MILQVWASMGSQKVSLHLMLMMTHPDGHDATASFETLRDRRFSSVVRLTTWQAPKMKGLIVLVEKGDHI